MRKSIPLQCFLLLILNYCVSAQTPEAILDSINAGRKPEKLFTHFDKNFYLPGETIWFNTYVTVDGFPGTYSSVAKTELIDAKGKIIASKIIPVISGTIAGDLALPSRLDYGMYLFRVYTQQMLATGIDNSYYKAIPVMPAAAYNSSSEVKDINLQFFPEGGTFLADELNSLAFAATDQNGKPVMISGVIKDGQGKESASFTASVNGMGKVELKPVKGEKYTAWFQHAGISKSVPLPALKEEGTNMFVIDEISQKQLFIDSRFSNDTQKPAYLLGEMDQTTVLRIDLRKSNGHYHGNFPVKDFPAGLLHLAVFNEQHQVLAERTCLVINPKDIVQPVFNTVSTDLGKRGENKFELSLPDSLEGSFSISVTDNSQSLPAAADNIISSELLTAGLKQAGNPWLEPGTFEAGIKNEAADLLLLTHGYKWDWQQLNKLAAAPLPRFDESLITVKGTASSEITRKALAGAQLNFIVQAKDSSSNFFIAETDDKGYFEVPGLFFEDSAVLFVKNQTDKNRDKKVTLSISSKPLTEQYKLPVSKEMLASPWINAFNASEAIRKAPVTAAAPVDYDSSVVVLQELVIEARSKSPTQKLDERYSSGLFANNARSVIDFVNQNQGYMAGNIFDHLKGRYSYIQVLGNSPNYVLMYRNMRSLGSGAPIPMSLYLDETPVDAMQLTTVSLRDIAMVKIYTSGIMGVGGAVAVYTKKGADNPNADYTLMNKIKLPGFSKVETFDSPDYKKLSKNAVKSDNRKTLYWNPSLTVIPEDGKLPVSFFNSDQSKGYKIVLQGFTTNGKLVYLEKVIR